MDFFEEKKMAALAVVIADLQLAAHKNDYTITQIHKDVEKISKLAMVAREKNGIKDESCETELDVILDLCHGICPPF